jgi:dynein heavy chain 2
LTTYSNQITEKISVEDFTSTSLPVIRTADVQRFIDSFSSWLHPENRQPFILNGPEGCGKGLVLCCHCPNSIICICFIPSSLLLQHCFDSLRSSQVATIHCSAQTSPSHILQKLSQMCMTISTNTGRVYKPKDCERMILYLKDLNLPKPDKWGTSQLTTFLQQLLTYNGFYDSNLEFVGLDGVQIVASMSAGSSLGRHKLTTRFTSVVRLCSIRLGFVAV